MGDVEDQGMGRLPPAFSRHLRLLVQQKLVLKRRAWISTCCELFIPVLVLTLLLLISSVFDIVHIPSENYNVIPEIDARGVEWPRAAQRAMQELDRNESHPQVIPPFSMMTSLCLGKWDTPKKLAFAPNNAAVQDLVTYLQNRSWYKTCINDPPIFPTEADAEEWAVDKGAGKLWALIVSAGGLGTHEYRFTLRMNNSRVPATRHLTERFALGRGSAFENYMQSGFMGLQAVLDEYVACRLDKNMCTNTIDLLAAEMPYPVLSYSKNPFYDTAGPFMALLFALAFIYPFMKFVKNMVEEKELRLKEGMLMMGLHPASYPWGWAVVSAGELLLGCLLAMLPVSQIFKLTSFTLLLFMLYLYTLANAALCFVLASLFGKARTASLFCALFLFFSVVPIFFVTDDVGKGWEVLCSFLPSMAFGYCINRVAKFEGGNVGAGWSSDDLTSGTYSLGDGIGMLLVDLFLYHILSWYLGHVSPGEYGIPKKPWFLFTSQYWFPKGSRGDSTEMTGVGQLGPSGNDLVEDVPAELSSSSRVQIRNLKKSFGTFVAVNDLSFDMFEGQITVLLGHNGAGKTTSINMMTGMLPPTSGDCISYGNSILGNLRAVRQDLGVCPQHNILWPNYTVEEHLTFFAKMKGVPGPQVSEAVRSMIQSIGLPDKAGTWSSALSGGMKRRLSVGMALIGGSRLVFLDEPTAGMDPEAREHTHTLLAESAAGRVVVLTTHFMDEADKLGDRVAIMAHGKLQCMGSPLFLKSRLGVGYHLTVAVHADAAPAKVTNVVLRHVPTAVPKTEVGLELSYLLPMDAVGSFAALFRNLEEDKADLKVDAFGMSMTTLEDVFMGIAMEGEHEEEAEVDSEDEGSPEDDPMQSDGSIRKSPKGAMSARPLMGEQFDPEGGRGGGFEQQLESMQLLRGVGLLFRQFAALLTKRFHCARRDKKFICCLVVLPVVDIIAALCLTLISVSQQDLALTPVQFMGEGPTEVSVANGHSSPIKIDPSEYGSGVTAAVNTLPDSLSVTNMLYTTYNDHPDVTRYGGVVLRDTVANVCCFDANGNYDTQGSTRPVTVDTVIHNTSSLHALPTYYSMLNEAKLRAINTDVNRTVYAHPLPQSVREKAIRDSFRLIGAAVVILFPFTAIPANFAAFVVKERVCKAKHVQLVSGVNVAVYWLSTYVADMVLYTVTMLLTILTFIGFQKEEYVGSTEKVFGIMLLFTLYGMAATSLSYVLQFPFQSHSTAQNILMMANLIFGVFLVIATQIMQNIDSTRDINNTLMKFYRVVPSYCLGEGILAMSSVRLIEIFTGEAAETFDKDILGRPLSYLAVEAPMFLLVVLIIELVSHRLQNMVTGGGAAVGKPEEDPDVVEERVVEQGTGREGDLVTVQNLRKVYSARGGAAAKVAVENLSFGVHQDEIFALLGTNGAGKTTTLSILSGEFPMTSGAAYLSGYNITTQMRDARRNLGYCPQFDALLDLMTVREHLTFYARIRGLPSGEIPRLVDTTMQHLGLTEYRNKRSKKLSGGNKRKLSMGIAIIGGPRVVFLDEPSAGMDPVARRAMCDAIMGAARGRSVVLTTHHLEEVEALANRVGIMVAGKFRCLGTLQHLKAKYGEGYWLEFRVADSGKASVIDFVSSEFGQSTVEEQQPGFLRIKASDPDLRLSTLFEKIEANRGRLGVDDYSVSQPNLEQVFLNISKSQGDQET